MKKSLLLATSLLVSVISLFSQGAITIGAAATADASAVLDIRATDKGVLVPGMLLSEKLLIKNPANGLMIFQTNDTIGFWYYNQVAAKWMQAGDNLGSHTLSQNLVTGGRYISRTGNSVGIQIFDTDGSIRFRGTGTVGGLAAPHDNFRFDNNGGLVAIGQLGAGILPASGPGVRMMWHPYKAAFRAGEASLLGNEMDDQNMGFHSWAGGRYNTALGNYSFAFGDRNATLQPGSVAFGIQDTVTSSAGFAAGMLNRVSGTYGAAIGFANTASGPYSLAMGYRSSAKDDYCMAFGYKASSGNHSGTLAMTDASTTDTMFNTANNQFAARFAGGYRFYTNSTKTTGVTVGTGGNSWSSISDSSKKEKYLPADGEAFLAKLQQLKLGSWNYKGQPEAGYRHYGPMAQEIFAAYGKDNYGSIGCDTLLATADMDGIMMVLLQALEKRSSDQQATNNQMKEELSLLKNENKMLKDHLAKMESLQQQVLALQAKAGRAEMVKREP
ncbi:MAG: tail fiber domain-containing protein [Bacteroidota bacterium]